jgi:hypothetical protein
MDDGSQGEDSVCNRLYYFLTGIYKGYLTTCDRKLIKGYLWHKSLEIEHQKNILLFVDVVLHRISVV